MNKGKRKNWAVLCGLVRNLKLFTSKLDKLIQLRSEGLIEGIVYSTWIGEIDKYEGLRSQLENGGLKIVETLEPSLVVSSHILHQMKAIHYGLEACPDDVYIFKMRPDLCDICLDDLQVLSGNLDLTVDDSDGWPRIFQERIVLLSGSVLAPFYQNDIQFYGRKQDIKKLIHFDLRYEVLFSDMGPEQFFHAHPFIENFPIFISYFQIYQGFFFNNFDMGRHYTNYFISSPFLMKILMTYILILSRYYRVRADFAFPDKVAQEREIIKKLPCANIFEIDTDVPGLQFFNGPNTIIFTGETWIHSLLDGEFCRDAVGERLYEALTEVKEWSFHQNWIANALDPHPEVIKVYQDFGRLFAHNRGKIAIQPESKLNNTYVIRGAQNRFKITNDDSVDFQKEINVLRRKIDALNESLNQKNDELKKLREGKR